MAPAIYEQIASALLRHLDAGPEVEPRLGAALRQLAVHPGKLMRAALAYETARRAGVGRRNAERLACAVEYFHVASLVLDDLPCMDDAAMRRGMPCVHRQHGEATAILAALALINRAYALMGEALAGQPRRVREEAWSCLTRALGTAGLVGGQAWDLAFAGTDRSARTVSRIAAAKTAALFSLAIMVPGLLLRPTRAERRALRALGVYWGQLVQIADDFVDVMAPGFEVGKTTGRDGRLVRPNLVLALGLPRARARLDRLTGQAARVLAQLEQRGKGRWRQFREAGETLTQVCAVREPARSAA
jgi:geranylgeranyl pyrophosphate synthase